MEHLFFEWFTILGKHGFYLPPSGVGKLRASNNVFWATGPSRSEMTIEVQISLKDSKDPVERTAANIGKQQRSLFLDTQNTLQK